MNRTEFGRLHGVSPAMVTEWQNRNWLVFHGDGSIDEPASSANVKRYRKAKNKKQNADKVKSISIQTMDDETASQAADRIIQQNGAPWGMDEALRVKENFLALLRQLEYEQKSGALVPIEEVKEVLFDEFRALRDAWLNWPTRIGPLMAADLRLEPEPVIEALTNYVYKHLDEIGESPDDERILAEVTA